MASFDINTSGSVKNVTELTDLVRSLGQAVDRVEQDAKKGLAGGLADSAFKAAAAARDVRAEFMGLTREATAFSNVLRGTRDLKAYITQLHALETSQQRSQYAAERATRAASDTEKGYRNAELASKERLKTEEQLAGANVKTEEGLRRVSNEMRQLASANGQALAAEKERLAGARQAAVEDQRRINSTEKLRRELEFLRSTEGRKQAALQVSIRAERQASGEMANRTVEAARLAREIAFLQSAEGRRLMVLRQQAVEERRAATATAEAAVVRRRSLNIGNQLTAGFRSGLMGLRTSIGMYTSSTILAASAVFGLARAFRSGLEAGSEFTASMARARAIMAASPQEFSALQAQVEALGAATQFSSTEVAEAAVELAKVGLSASQAISALRPVLDIATLANADIATAAKLATDVMFVFGKQVGDLSDISDVMATAIARSSTTVEELVKGLTYAGPAAHAAGISMRDTVAAMEALANAGIRGSRAGTALRMMIDRLSDPTVKGARALQRMGVSMLNLRGEAKSLTEILKEFQAAQQSMTGPEFLGGLGDFVGVRQASALANLINNTDNMVKFRKELELSTGASDKMVQSLRDVAKFDWENLTSAFQALQISVFQDNEFQIRGFIESLRHFFDFLNERIGDNGVTRLESYITRLVHIGQVVAAVFTVKYLLKFSSGLITLAGKLEANAFAYGMVAKGANTAKIATDGYTASVIRQTVAVDASAVGMKAWAGRAALANTAMAGAAAGASRIGGLLAAGSALLGWVGILGAVAYGVVQVYRAFTDGGAKTSTELKQRTEEAKESYKVLKDASDEAMKEQERVNFARSLDFQAQSVVKMKEQIKATERYRDAAMEAAQSDNERALLAEKYALILDVQTDKLNTATESLKNFQQQATSGVVGNDPGAEATRVVLQMNEVRSQIEAISGAAGGAKIGEKLLSPADEARIEDLKKKLAGLNDQLVNLGKTQGERERGGGMTADEALAAANKLVNDSVNKAFSEHADTVLKDTNALRDSAQAAKESRDAYDAAVQAVIDAKNGTGNLTEAIDKLSTAARNGMVIQGQYAGMLGDLAKNSHDLAKAYDIGVMSPSARKAAYKEQLDEANKALAAIKAASASAGFKDPALNPLLAGDYNRYLKQRNEAAQGSGLFNQRTSTRSTDNFLSNLREQLNPIAEEAEKARKALDKLKSYTGDDKALLAGQVEYNRLKSTLGFSPDSLEDQIKAIEKWRTEQHALAASITDLTERKQVNIQIDREADSLTNQRIDQLKREQFAIEDYSNALRDQETVLQQQVNDKIAAIGVGQQEGAHMQELTKLQREFTNQSIRLQREHTRALDSLRDKGNQDQIDKENEKYRQKEQDLRDSYDRRRVITEKGYRDLLAAQGSVKLGVEGGLSQVIEDGTNLAGKMSQAVVGGFNDMADAVVNFAKTGKFSLKDFALNFAEMMLRMELAALEAKAARAILGLLAPSAPAPAPSAGSFSIGTPGSRYGSYNLGFAKGGAFDRGNLVAMAKGGLITGPTIFPMARGGLALGGEVDTEAIMPLDRTPSGVLGVRAMGLGGGGDVFNFQTNVNIDQSGASTSSTTGDQNGMGRQLAGLIEAKAKEVVVRATQPGGIIWKQRNGVTA